MPVSWKRRNTLPTIRLQDPLLHNSFTKGKFTTYKILIETEHHAFHLRTSCIRRRYSELRWLCTTLQAHHKQTKLPPIPSKKIWSERFNANFVNIRMKEIEVFLNDLIKIDTILSDTAVHLFLQTDLMPEEMDSYLKGQMDDAVLEKVWQNQGHRHTANELGTFLSIATPREITMDSEDEMLASSSNSPASTKSTHFTNISINVDDNNENGDTDNENLSPTSFPAKIITATTTSGPLGVFHTVPPPRNKKKMPQIPELSDECHTTGSESETSTLDVTANTSDNDISSSGVNKDNDISSSGVNKDNDISNSGVNKDNDISNSDVNKDNDISNSDVNNDNISSSGSNDNDISSNGAKSENDVNDKIINDNGVNDSNDVNSDNDTSSNDAHNDNVDDDKIVNDNSVNNSIDTSSDNDVNDDSDVNNGDDVKSNNDVNASSNLHNDNVDNDNAKVIENTVTVIKYPRVFGLGLIDMDNDMNDSASDMTTSTDDSTRNSSPALSEGTQSIATMSTNSVSS